MAIATGVRGIIGVEWDRYKPSTAHEPRRAVAALGEVDSRGCFFRWENQPRRPIVIASHAGMPL
jgi:hypothetical protein